MKKQALNKKLNLAKITISNLDNEELAVPRGGHAKSAFPTYCTI